MKVITMMKINISFMVSAWKWETFSVVCSLANLISNFKKSICIYLCYIAQNFSLFLLRKA